MINSLSTVSYLEGEDLKDVLSKVLNVASGKFGAEYVEARAQRLLRTMLTLKEGRVEAARQGIENGTALGGLGKGAGGFASVGSLDSKVLVEAVSDACKMAKVASSRLKAPIKLAETKTVEDKVLMKPRKDPSKVSIEEKIDTNLTLNKEIMGFDSRVKSCTIDYLDLTGTSYFMNSDGSYIEQDKLYVWARAVATAVAGDVLTFSREEIGSTSGYEVFDVQTPESVGKMVAERAVCQLKAKTPKGGAFGSYKDDDEGVPAQKTLLVKNGVVAGLMHNRETAQKFGVKPTGNARAEDFHVEPIIRMRNTFIEPRDHSLEELFEGIKFGYYLKSFRGGQANLDGTFQVGVQEAYEIVNGEVGKPVRNASISGNTLETLLKVDAVGKDFELWPGRCGKGQTAFTCDGGAHTRVKEVLVGGSA